MSARSIGLSQPVYEYLCRVSVREPEVLRELRAETAGIEHAGMQISPEQGQFMALMAQIIGARRYIEVGTFTGYSALAVALALPEESEIVCCDVSEEWTSIARRYWAKAGVDGRIALHLRPGTETLTALIDAGRSGHFDMAFIDADKENYVEYYEKSLTLLRPGGLVLVDNVLWNGAVADPQKQTDAVQAIRALNAHLTDDDRVDIAMLPLGDGVFMARKRG